VAVGQHSTARFSNIFASSSSSNSTAFFQSLTEFGIFSRAFLKTLRFPFLSFSKLAAAHQILTDVGISATAAANIFFAWSPGAFQVSSRGGKAGF